MSAGDTAARAILEEDRQAEAILKEFAKGTSVLCGDPVANLLVVRNMMSPGHTITRSSDIKGQKQKAVATTPKKKNFPRHAMDQPTFMSTFCQAWRSSTDQCG
jgi:hypothetical protein